MFAICVLNIRELNWYQRFRDKKTKLKLSYHLLSSSTQLQNKSFHVAERTRTSAKFPDMKNARPKRAKLLFFIVKYANLRRSLLPSSPWLLKLTNNESKIKEKLKLHEKELFKFLLEVAKGCFEKKSVLQKR